MCLNKKKQYTERIIVYFFYKEGENSTKSDVYSEEFIDF